MAIAIVEANHWDYSSRFNVSTAMHAQSIETVYRRPKATILLVAGFFVLGAVAYFQLPISTLPDADFSTINGQATLPGARAVTMASSVVSSEAPPSPSK